MANRRVNNFLPVKSIMTRDVKTVEPDTLILDAIRLLVKHRISGLPVVVGDNILVGILTEKDVLQVLTQANVSYQDTVEKYMTRKVISFKEDDSAITVCQFFQRNSRRRVPIVKDGKLIGIVSRRDIISLILEAKSNFAAFRFS